MLVGVVAVETINAAVEMTDVAVEMTDVGMTDVATTDAGSLHLRGDVIHPLGIILEVECEEPLVQLKEIVHRERTRMTWAGKIIALEIEETTAELKKMVEVGITKGNRIATEKS